MVFEYGSGTNKLNDELNKILETVIDNVSKKLLDDFLRHLDSVVYIPAPDATYERYYKNGGFYSGWCIKEFSKLIKALVFNGDNLIAPGDDMRNSQMSHGGSDGNDYRYKMAWILNSIASNDDYSYNGGATYLSEGNNSVGYWDSYLRDIDKKIEKWLDAEFKKYGISRG